MSRNADHRIEQVRGFLVRATAIVAGAFAVYEILFSGDPSSEAWSRAALPAILCLVAVWEWTHDESTETLHLLIIGLYGGGEIVEMLVGRDALSSIDTVTTLTVLLLVAVIYVATREGKTTGPVVAIAVFMSIFSVVAAVLGDYTPSQAVSILLIGVLGQAVALWLVHRLIGSLVEKSTSETRHAQVQTALARCSQALLNRGTERPLETALEALLDATEADYTYIDINRVAADGSNTWEIIAEAHGPAYPDKGDEFMSGDYRQMEFVADLLRSGRPAPIMVRDLEMPLRGAYEREGVKAELMAPIHIGARWIGSIGYTDHVRDGDWTDIEVEGLMRAAEMVGAYWDREAAREGLMELAKAKDRFIATVSHELRTPLTAVVGFAAELLERTGSMSADEMTELASLIHDQGVELSQLVEDLLTAERAASGNLTVRPGEIPLLEYCRGLVASTAGDREVDVEGEEVLAWADPLRTRQIIRNLLTNAFRYGGDSVVIEVGRVDGLCSVVVRDNGAGVKGVDVDRIFDPYYRAQDGRIKPDSVGLGLAVCRQLAGLMDGNVEYRRFGGWTRFQLTLPLAEARMEPAAP